jgi:phosphoglycerol transferase
VVNKKIKIDYGLLMAITIAVLAFALLLRNEGLYPIVFADELTYSKFARLVPLQEALIPNFLYFAIYRATNFCGDGFLGCARILNILFFIGSFPFIYATAKKFTSRRVAGLVAFLTLAGASNSYTAYFMPETIYFFSFWVLVWSLIKLDKASSATKWLVPGVILGIASLIKPHGLFLLPAVLAYCVLILIKRADNKYRHIVYSTVSLVVATFATKLVGGFILAGKNGVTLFGTFYSPYADTTQNREFEYYWTLIKTAALNASGHSLALCFVYAIPVVIFLRLLVRKNTSGDPQNSEVSPLLLLSGLVIVDLIAVTALFTASIAADSSVYYLHIRYYFFALPLLLIAAARELESGRDEGGRLARALCAMPVIAAIIYVMAKSLKPFDAISSIAPELYGLVAQPIILYSAGCISIASLLAWICSPRHGAKAYLFVFVPFAVLSAGYIVNNDLRYRMKPDVFDQAGVFTRTYLNHDQRSRTLIVGTDSEVAGLFRVLYYFDLPNTDYGQLDGPNSSIKLILREAAFNIQDLPETKNWILVIGDHPLSGATDSAVRGAGYTLYQVKK